MSNYLSPNYEGETRFLFFKATEIDPVNPPNPEKGWKKLLGNKLKIVEIPGNHISMMFNPHVERIAKLLFSLFSLNGKDKLNI